MTFTTWLGQTISPGDTIVYPSRQGSSVHMNYGIVIDIKEEKGLYYSGIQKVLYVQKIRFNQYSFRTKPERYKPSKLTALGNITKCPDTQ